MHVFIEYCYEFYLTIVYNIHKVPMHVCIYKLIYIILDYTRPITTLNVVPIEAVNGTQLLNV